MSLHKVVSNPQFISTDRHIMQGLVDFEKIPEWNRSKKTLSGISKVIKDETYTVVLALNGYRIKECSAEGAEITYSNIDENMCKIKILATDNKSVVWNVHFKK